VSWDPSKAKLERAAVSKEFCELFVEQLHELLAWLRLIGVESFDGGLTVK
jgi:hypothetical protein